MPASVKPPIRERGVVTNQPPPDPGHGFTWGAVVDEAEQSPQLQWPNSVDVFQSMLNDSQINALRMAVTLPLKRRRWLIDPNGAEDRIVEHIATDLGLPIVGDDAKPKVVDPRRFAWGRHLHHVLLAPFMGHYFFSQYAPIDQADGLAHLRKLLPLPPRTIAEIRVAQDGGLEWIRQHVGRGRDRFDRPDPIPVTALVAYVWEQEAGNWLGRSMLRSVYRDWLAKDDLIRSNMVKHRRNGMGIPLAFQTERDADVSQAQKMLQIASAARAGEEAAAAIPYGYDLRFRGVEGTVPDATPSIKMHDEAMARNFLAMFLQLGQTERGARALGDSFIDFFATALDAVADDGVSEPTTLHVIRDLVDWNYGEGVELIPLLVSERDEDPELSVSDLAELVDKGVIVVDEEIEDAVRARHGLPARSAARVPPPSTGDPEPALSASTSRPTGGTRNARAGLVRRAWDRLRGRAADAAPAAGFVDWDTIDTTTTEARDRLVDAWQQVRAAQIAELVQQIEDAAGDLSVLASLRCETRAVELVGQAMADMADLGVQTVIEEAAAQGVTLADPWERVEGASAAEGAFGWLLRPLSRLRRLIGERSEAIAETMAQSISEAASREAVRRTSDAVAPADVAREVGEHLTGLSNAFLEEQLGAAVHQGFGIGRAETMRDAPAGTRVEASSLLDRNVCTPCSHDDGRVWDSLAEAEAQFPAGQNKDCEGRGRCRCTLVLVIDEATPSVA